LSDELPNVNWSDTRIVQYARHIMFSAGSPIVYVPLVHSMVNEPEDTPDTAEVSFYGPIKVRRFRRVPPLPE